MTTTTMNRQRLSVHPHLVVVALLLLLWLLPAVVVRPGGSVDLDEPLVLVAAFVEVVWDDL